MQFDCSSVIDLQTSANTSSTSKPSQWTQIPVPISSLLTSFRRCVMRSLEESSLRIWTARSIPWRSREPQWISGWKEDQHPQLPQLRVLSHQPTKKRRPKRMNSKTRMRISELRMAEKITESLQKWKWRRFSLRRNITLSPSKRIISLMSQLPLKKPLKLLRTTRKQKSRND